MECTLDTLEYPQLLNLLFICSPLCSLCYQGSREQLAIAEFANSLLVIPKTLAVNAAQDSADLVAKLRAYHNTSQINTEKSSLKWYVPFEYFFFFSSECYSKAKYT